MRIVFEIGPTLTSLESAKELARITKMSGAHAVKIQMLNPDVLMADKSIRFQFSEMSKSGEVVPSSDSLYEILKRRALSDEDWLSFFQYCELLNLDVISTVTSPHYVDLAMKLGAKELKIASGDITYLQLIERASRTKLPIHLDTGRASIQEIREAIQVAAFTPRNEMFLHYCPPGYPAKIQDVQLNIIPLLKREFNLRIGYSDHFTGFEMNLAAIAIGADIIEKTLTLDKFQQGPEHMFSLEPHETIKFVELMHLIESASSANEMNLANYLATPPNFAIRRSLYSSQEITKGEKLTDDKVAFKRPGTFLPPSDLDSLVGKFATRDIAINTPLTLDMFS